MPRRRPSIIIDPETSLKILIVGVSTFCNSNSLPNSLCRKQHHRRARKNLRENGRTLSFILEVSPKFTISSFLGDRRPTLIGVAGSPQNRPTWLHTSFIYKLPLASPAAAAAAAAAATTSWERAKRTEPEKKEVRVRSASSAILLWTNFCCSCVSYSPLLLSLVQTVPLPVMAVGYPDGVDWS